MNDKALENFIIANSPDGGFLQSEHWRKFQESVGKETYNVDLIEAEKPVAYANIIEHILPAVGRYFYIPRGPIFEKAQSTKSQNAKQNTKHKTQIFLRDLVNFAKENKASWIRIEPNSEEDLGLIKDYLPNGLKIKKAPVDVQPKEILILDISKSEEEILAGMKQKTRYNIRLSQKRGVSVKLISNFQFPISKQYVDIFLRLVKITAKRDGIKSHPESYYRQMFETIPPEVLKLYVAEYEGKAIAANLVLFFGKTATYLHGASDNIHRDAMAPYLLQWRQIQDAKGSGCERYDFGGIKSMKNDQRSMISSWAGITKFKTGFSPNTQPIRFPGCWDIILSPPKYWLYRILRKIRP